jgi:hypothetical protein
VCTKLDIYFLISLNIEYSDYKCKFIFYTK